MADAQRVEIGFEGGQVISARLADDDLKDLRKQLEKGGWHDLHTEDGVLASTSARSPSSASSPATTASASAQRLMRPRLLGAAALATLAAALWWRKNPSACPYGQRFWVEAPHPIITRDRLRQVLRPEPGERLLEIGVGTGYYTLDMAEWVGPDGKLEIFDLQQEFLDHVMRPSSGRARLGQPHPDPGRRHRPALRGRLGGRRRSSPPCSARSPTHRSPPRDPPRPQARRPPGRRRALRRPPLHDPRQPQRPGHRTRASTSRSAPATGSATSPASRRSERTRVGA